MKILHSYKLQYFAILLFLMQSCSTYYYYPTQQNVLQFSEKSDAQCTYVVGEDETTASVGYAFHPNIAFSTSFRSFYGKNSLIKTDTYIWENEFAFFYKTQNNFIGACNIGYGLGNLDDGSYFFNGQEYKNAVKINREFIQPSIGYKSKFFDFALSSRISQVNYRENYNFNNLGFTPFYFIEPALTVGIGYKNIKLRCQKVYIQKISSGELKYVQQALNFSLNVTCNINNMKLKILK